MGIEEIEVKEQWDVVTTLKELEELRAMVVRFMEHTLQTMGKPRTYFLPDGTQETTDEVIHPLGEAIASITACVEGCHKAYGKQMYDQAKLFNDNFGTEDEIGY
jgi:hypothetical protein